MKQILLFVLAIMVSGFATAQTITPGVSSTEKTATPTLNGEIRFTGNQRESRMVADTLFPTALGLDCANTVQLFTADTSGTTYVVGSNNFNDFEKLQRITLPEAVDFTVSEVLVAFGALGEGVADRTVAINIYTDLGADGSFGTLAGTSDSLTFSEIMLNDSVLVFTSFTFSTPAEITGASSFLVSVDVSDIYFDAAGAFDPQGNVGIFSTPADCGDGNNLFEIFPNADGGLSFNSVFNNWGMLNTEMFVGAIVDRGQFSSTRTANADFGATAFPNPVETELTVSFDAPVAGDYQVRVVSAAGAVVSQQTVSAVRGVSRSNVDVSAIPAGVYLFQVEGANGVQTGRFVKR